MQLFYDFLSHVIVIPQKWDFQTDLYKIVLR